MSNSKEELIETLVAALKIIYGDKPQTESVVDAVITSWYEEIDGQLGKLISEWEERIPDDKTLYTLGIRRAIDVVHGQDIDTVS